MANTSRKLEQKLSRSLRALRSVRDDLATIKSEDIHKTQTTAHLAAELVDVVGELQRQLDPPHVVLADHYLGYMQTKCLCAALEFNIPDILPQDCSPVKITELSAKSNAHEHRLRQVLRALSGSGVFTFDYSRDTCRHNDVSLLMTDSSPGKWKYWVELYGNQFYEMARGIPEATYTDATRSAAQVAFDTDQSMFEYFNTQGWVPQLHQALSAGAAAMASGITGDYPWYELNGTTFLDVGSGTGTLVAEILDAHPGLSGALFDRHHVIDIARSMFDGGGEYAHLAHRVEFLEGDFFERIPRFEAYTIKWVLHDWADEQALVILGNIRAAIRVTPRARLVLLESLLGEGMSQRISRYADINMMMTIGGQERDEMAWRRLAERSGWMCRRILTLRGAWPSAIEFVPV